MKKCKVIHINDGSASVRENGNFRFVEEFDFTESYLNNLMSEGWEHSVLLGAGYLHR